MAAVPITIVGMATREDGTAESVTIVGLASITGLQIGGGPIVEPPHPEHPIVLPPPYPAHPIVIPEPPTEVPPGNNQEDGMVKDPPPNGGWGYNETFGWGYFPGKSGAGPKK